MIKVINEKALAKSIELMDNMMRAKKTAEELAASYQARISVMEEFIQANYTGDDVAFNVLKEDVKSYRGRAYPYYRGRGLAPCPTRLIVKKAQEYIACLTSSDSSSTI